MDIKERRHKMKDLKWILIMFLLIFQGFYVASDYWILGKINFYTPYVIPVSFYVGWKIY